MAKEFRLHEKMKSRWVFHCEIIPNGSSIHLGGAREEYALSSAQLPIFTLETEKPKRRIPIIPGSSLKGVFRSLLEVMWCNVPLEVWKEVLSTDGDSLIEQWKQTLKNQHFKDNKDYYEKYDEKETKDKQKRQLIEEKFLKEEDTEKKLEIFKKIDPIVKLFGVSGFRSCVRFSTAFPVINESGKAIHVLNRTHVRINPNTDRTVQGNLFTMEATPPDLRFQFYLVYDELDDDQLLLSNAIFKKIVLDPLIKKKVFNLTLGGHVSRGYGHVTIKLVKGMKYDAMQLFLGKGPTEVYQ